MDKYKDAHELYPLPMCDVCHNHRSVVRKASLNKCLKCFTEERKIEDRY